MYARRGKNRICPRVVGEYDGETLSEKCARTSKRPLTLGQLATFFDDAWSTFDTHELRGEAYDLEAMQNFVIGVDSQFYPDIDLLYRQRITTWAAERRRACGLDQEPEHEDTRVRVTEQLRHRMTGSTRLA